MIKLGMRIAIIALLLLSGAALVMGLMLFQQRETLKGRTLKLEAAIKQVASTLEAGDGTDDKLVIPDLQLKTYKQKPGGPPPMDIPLNQLALAAQNQLSRLNGARGMLAENKAALAKAESELGVAQTNLASARAEVATLNAAVPARNTVIADLEGTIKNLEREKGELNAKFTEQNAKITGLETDQTKLKETIASLEDKAKKAEIAKATESAGKPVLTKGKHGKVLYVDPEWNFLIISLASPEIQRNTEPDVEFIIHRADKLVGKIRIKTIENDMAIADIISDWMQLPPQKGDDVIL